MFTAPYIYNVPASGDYYFTFQQVNSTPTNLSPYTLDFVTYCDNECINPSRVGLASPCD